MSSNDSFLALVKAHREILQPRTRKESGVGIQENFCRECGGKGNHCKSCSIKADFSDLKETVERNLPANQDEFLDEWFRDVETHMEMALLDIPDHEEIDDLVPIGRSKPPKDAPILRLLGYLFFLWSLKLFRRGPPKLVLNREQATEILRKEAESHLGYKEIIELRSFYDKRRKTNQWEGTVYCHSTPKESFPRIRIIIRFTDTDPSDIRQTFDQIQIGRRRD